MQPSCHWGLVALVTTEIDEKKVCLGVSLDHENHFSECYWYFDNALLMLLCFQAVNDTTSH